MFKLSENYEIVRRILKCDYIRYSPAEISTINTASSQIYINIPREDSITSLLNSYLELNFDVIHAATNNRYKDANDIRLVNLGPISFFSTYKLTTSSGKHLEEISHAYIVSLMYKLLTSSKDSDDLSIGFDRNRGTRKNELANNKNIKGKYHIRIYLKGIFGFAEHQEKGTYGLGYKLTLTRNTDNAVLNKDNAVANGRIKINSLDWYVPHYSPNLEEYTKLMNQIKKNTPTLLHYPERSVFMKEVNTQNLWTFELGTQECINVPIWIFVAFQQNDRQNDQNLNNDTFYRPLVTSAQCIIGTEKYPDSSILLNYNDDDYSQGYGQIKEAFKALTKDNLLQQNISEHDYRSSNDGNNIGYNIYAFDIRYQENFESSQPIKVEFKFDGVVPAGIYGYALVLTNRLISISSDGQRMFDLNYVIFNFFITLSFSFIFNSVFFNNDSLYLSFKLWMW